MMAGSGPYLMVKNYFGNFCQIFPFYNFFSDFAENYELVAHEIVALDGI